MFRKKGFFMSEFKYHVGFPCDCVHNPKYFLLYPIESGVLYHHKCKIGEKHELEEWKGSPHSFNRLEKLVKNKKMQFHCSSDNFPFSGNSGDLAYYVAGLSNNIAEPMDKNCPFFFFSVALEITASHDKITDPILHDVGGDAGKSLENKWEIISDLSKKGKVVFFLHVEDWAQLKNIINKDYEEFELKPNSEKSDLLEMTGKCDLVVVSLKNDDIGLLLNLLEIYEEDENENNRPKSFKKFFWFFLLIVTVGLLSIGGYFYYEEAKRRAFCDSLSKEEINEMTMTQLEDKKREYSSCQDKIDAITNIYGELNKRCDCLRSASQKELEEAEKNGDFKRCNKK